MDAPVRVNKLMDHAGLCGLVARTRQLEALTRALDAVLPASLTGMAAVTDYREGMLVVSATTAAVATRLRFLEAALCVELRRAGGALGDIRALRCKVAHTAVPAPRPPRAQTPPARSSAGARALASSARGVRDDGLRAAVQRLADHLAGTPPTGE